MPGREGRRRRKRDSSTRARALPRAFALGTALVLLLALALVPACSLGEGNGTITGTLDVPNCWSGKFDLHPDFFAGVPYRDSLQLRIQNGGDFQTFSDGLSILVDDIHAIRGDNGKPSLLGEPLTVSLPPGVSPPGVPLKGNPDPASVHLVLYLQKTCRTQNVALYAMDSVSLNADGSCGAVDGGEVPQVCGTSTDPLATGTTDGGMSSDASLDGGSSPATGPDAGPPNRVGKSTITFLHLFDNQSDETDAAERLNEGTFDVFLADPREICPGGIGPPPRCRGELTGTFRFYFERGRPAQPFP